MNAPLVLIGFNRPETHVRVLDNLAKCLDLHGADGKREAYAFLDGSRGQQDEAGVAAERVVVERFKAKHYPELNIVIRPHNFGCRENIVSGISEVLNQHGRAIIIEDDILVSRTFLQYMDEALTFYESDPRIWCINANTYPSMKVPRKYVDDVYLHPRNMCWGWGTWLDRWEKVDFDMIDWPQDREDMTLVARMDALDKGIKSMLEGQYAGRLRTWDVQCTYHMFKYGLYAVEPRYPLSKNIGTGTAGVHCKNVAPEIASQRYYNYLPRLVPVDPDSSVLRNLGRCGFNPRLDVRIFRRLKREIFRYAPLHDAPIDL